MKLIPDLAAYLKAIFVESQRLVFTVFDLVGIVLFFFPHLAEGLVRDEALARTIGGLIFFASFLLGNFTLHRRMAKTLEEISESKFAVYPYKLPPYNAAEIRHYGSEAVKDLKVWLIYKDNENRAKQVQVEGFFPENDTRMILEQFKANVLKEDQLVRFRLLGKKNTGDGRVTIKIQCTGVKTGKSLEETKDLELDL